MKYRLIVALALFLPMLLSGCGAGGGQEVASNDNLRISQSDQLFQSDKLLQVDIQMDPEEYDILRQEGRYLSTLFSGCAQDFEYSRFKARVTVDGDVLEEVSIRKKGYLGSLSSGRPSFKLNFSEHRPGRRFFDLERMTLNNNNQDSSNTHTCMSYDLFRQAGLPTPRCNFARVSINGQDLGIYSHVESIKKQFLRRNFSSDKGNLYEAQIADFGAKLKDNFQLKTNQGENDRSDLDGVVSALGSSDENLPGALAQVVDLDEFLTFWAMETITGHWDSATGNANNYFIYNDPATNLFYYIPWGTDAALVQDSQLAPGSGPLYRFTNVAARLYEIPAYRDKYHARVLELLDKFWDADALNAQVDRIRALTQTPEENMQGVRAFIAEYDGKIKAEIAGETKQVERTIVDRETVCDDSGSTSISGTIVNGEGSVDLVDLDGDVINVPVTASFLADAGAVVPGSSVIINLVGFNDGAVTVFPILIEKSEFGKAEVPLHGFSTMILYGVFSTDSGFQVKGASGAGTVFFDKPPEIGGVLDLHFSADFVLNENVFRFLGGF